MRKEKKRKGFFFVKDRFLNSCKIVVKGINVSTNGFVIIFFAEIRITCRLRVNSCSCKSYAYSFLRAFLTAYQIHIKEECFF